MEQSYQSGNSPQNVNNSANPNYAQTKDYESVPYKISYPSSWTQGNRIVVGGGSLDSFISNSQDEFPRVDIQVTPVTSSSASIDTLTKNFILLGFQKDTTTFHGKEATRLVGTLNLSTKGQDPSITEKVNKVFLFLINNGYTYIIDYAYLADGTEQSSLNQINKILDSYEFR